VINSLIERTGWTFPPLEGIVCSPTLRPDGSLLAQPGYDETTGLFLDTNGTRFPEIPLEPTINEARAALAVLKEPFVDFPFAKPWHASATLAAVLSLVARHAVLGCVPLFAVRATDKGAGKGLLVDTIAMIGTGRTAPRWPQVREEDEERKRLLTIGLDGDACTHIDNVVAPLGCAPLDTALTSLTFKDRLLGKQQSVEVPMTVVFFASGNNMIFQGDTARRVVPIDIDPKVERPEERDGFQHAPLLEYVKRERPALVHAALTHLRAYFVAGCPRQGVSQYGSFEPWSDLIRQALVWAGEPDPCEGRKNLEGESDTGHEALAVLLHRWHQCYGTQAVTLRTVVQDIGRKEVRDVDVFTPANEWNELREALSNYNERLDITRMGYAFRKIAGKVIGNRRLITDGKAHAGATKWRLECV